MANKIRVGVIFGGKSGEHEVSVQSARSIISCLSLERYTIVPLWIDKGGRWHSAAAAQQVLGTDISRKLQLSDNESSKCLTSTASSGANAASAELAKAETGMGSFVPPRIEDIDVVIPALHGSYGEDGTVQGLLELMDVAYVGAGVLASAVGMDKVFMKRVFAAEGLPQVKYKHFTRIAWESEPQKVIDQIERELGYPCFVKPANLGSSVGISKAKTREELVEGIRMAARYDRKVIVEEGLSVREVEVAVLGNEHPKASLPGEVVSSNEFYDYDAKYISGESQLTIPASVSSQLTEEIRALAIRAFLALDCSGLSRVDFFIEKGTDRVLVNEINTMPGFTAFSMYPKLWEATGLSYEDLLNTLIELAIERHEDKRRTITDFAIPAKK